MRGPCFDGDAQLIPETEGPVNVRALLPRGPAAQGGLVDSELLCDGLLGPALAGQIGREQLGATGRRVDHGASICACA